MDARVGVLATSWPVGAGWGYPDRHDAGIAGFGCFLAGVMVSLREKLRNVEGQQGDPCKKFTIISLRLMFVFLRLS